MPSGKSHAIQVFVYILQKIRVMKEELEWAENRDVIGTI